MSIAATPDTTIASGDPGDEIGRRFRYQWTWSAIACCMLLDDTLGVSEIFCEHHEDILTKSSDGLFTGLQIKTRDSNQDFWKSSDEAVLKSCARFCKLDKEFPGQFRAFKFLSNHPLYSSGNGQDFEFVLEQIRVNTGSAALPTIVERFVKKVAKESKLSSLEVRTTLEKTDADDSLPKLSDIEMRLITTLVSGWERARDLTHLLVTTAARHLSNECGRASSLAHEDVLPAYLPATASSRSAAVEARLAGKRFNRDRLLQILESGLSITLPLDGDPLALAQPGSGNSSLLLKKLDAGGFSAISRNSAADLRDKADYLGLVWTKKFGQEAGLQRYGHIRSLVLSDAARAFEEVKAEEGPIGLPMLDKLRSRFQQRQAQGNQLYECSGEHLEGFAYGLTSECKVQWSLDRPWEDE